MRSIAWHCVFSSKLKTTARLGGFMYSPTTSTSLASKFGSLEILNVLTFHGLRLWSAQTLAMASLPSPNRLASNLVVQCVPPSVGLSWQVTRTISATVPSVSGDLRPRPLAIFPTPSTPCSAKRVRHRRTASGVT